MKRTPRLSRYYPPTRKNGLGWPHAAVLALHNHKLLYCPIGKNACTSLKRLMVSLSDIAHRPLFLIRDVHRGLDDHRTGLKLLDLEIDAARRIMESPDYYKFAVARDPVSRLASAYLEMFVVHRMRRPNRYHTGPVVAAVHRTGRPDFRRGITFAQFVRYVTAQDPRGLDPHWKPQSLYLEGIRYDRIYRMDELETLCRDLESRVGHPVRLEKTNVIEAPRVSLVPGAAHRYPGELVAPRSIDKQSLLDDDLAAAITRYYAEDFKLYEQGPPASPPAVPPAHVGSPAGAVPALRKPLRPTEPLFFLHLPKCGGTTLNVLFTQMFRRESEVYANHYRRRELLDTRPDLLRCYRLIRGHFQYPDVARKLGFPPRALTMLRDPVDRFISHFRMHQDGRWKPRSEGRRRYRDAVKRLSLEEFLARPELAAELADLQFRFLAGFRRYEAGRPFADFDQACDALLDKFDAVGILERFDESLRIFCHVFDLPPVETYEQLNVTPGNSRWMPPAAIRQRVAELNRHDLRLYALAKQRFEKLSERVHAELERHGGQPPMLEQPRDRVRLDMSRVPAGNNWRPSTEHRRHGCARWTGPGCASNLFLPLTPGPKRVRVEIIGCAGEDVLRSLKLVAAGAEVPLEREPGPARYPRVYAGTVPGGAIRPHRRTKLTLEVCRTRRRGLLNADRCGVLVSSVEVSPA